MHIIGYLGSPRVNGITAKLLARTLSVGGVENITAETVQNRLAQACRMGRRLVESLKQANRQSS